jgi:rhodanese-related sulfurtransferase
VIKAIRPAQLQDWITACLAENPQVRPLVLDVREPWELQTASIRADERFELVGMPMSSVPARLNELARERPIACLCHHGGRSAQVCYYLLNQGYDEVVNLHGGIHAWSQEVDPTVPQY